MSEAKYGYICAKPSYHFQKLFATTFKNNNISCIEEGEFHVTIAYDKTVNEQLITVPDLAGGKVLFNGVVKEVDIMGTRGDEWCSVALIIESEDLQIMHAKTKEAGYKYKWPDYRPHISLVYAFDEKDEARITELANRFVGKHITFRLPEIAPLKND